MYEKVHELVWIKLNESKCTVKDWNLFMTVRIEWKPRMSTYRKSDMRHWTYLRHPSILHFKVNCIKRNTCRLKQQYIWVDCITIGVRIQSVRLQVNPLMLLTDVVLNMKYRKPKSTWLGKNLKYGSINHKYNIFPSEFSILTRYPLDATLYLLL